MLVILSSNFQKSQLCDAREWYIDGTFWASPRRFYQILNIMIYNQNIKKPISVAQILMSSKKYHEYKSVLNNLITSLQIHDLVPKPEIIMSDFKNGLRLALLDCFPQSKILGCEFHFIKACWKKAAKLGLKKKELRSSCRVLLNLLTIISHINDIDIRNELFIQIQEIFAPEGEEFLQFTRYYEKNWLGLQFIDLSNTRELMTRTNNYCESFNSF
jgi:hypothetical protein